MKKVLTILTTIVLGSNTALLVTKPIDQGQKLDGIEGSPIFAQTITKNDNLIKDNSKQLTAGFIIEIIKMINKNRFSFEYSKITVENLEESENSAKSQIKSKFISFIKSKVKDLSHLDFDFKFINFISPKEFSLRETAPGFIEAKIGIKSTLEKEFLWSDFFLFKILFLPVIKITDMENIVISSRYNEYGFSDGVSYHDTLYFVNHNRVFSYNQKSGNVELAMQIKNKIVTNGVVYDNKLYFAADDYYVYGYNPRNNQVNKILKASNLIKSNGIVVENKLYFGSDDYCLYEYDAETNVVKVVLTADAEIRHYGTVYNNKLYFGTENGDFYVYDLKTNSFKVWKANDEVTVSDSGVIVNDSIYFTGIMKDKSSIYKLDLKTNLIWIWTFILPGKYISSIMFLNNKIYFFMTSIGNQAPILYEFDGNRIHWIESVHFLEMTRSCLKGIVYDNAIYLTHTTFLYKFTPEQNKGEIVFNSNASKSIRFLELNTCGIILNDKIYYGTFLEGIIEYNLRNNF